jgi:hypothetical protein
MEGRDRNGLWFEDNLGYEFMRTHLNKLNLGMAVHTYHPSSAVRINRGIAGQASLGVNMRSYLKNN